MTKYIITYDLKNSPARNYSTLIFAIKNIGPWWHYLESTWIIKTDLNAGQVWNYLYTHINGNDRLLIVKIEPYDKGGWLPQDAWAWLNS